MNRNEFFQALPVTRLCARLTSATLEICTDDIDDIHVMVSGADADVAALRLGVSGDMLTAEQPTATIAKAAVGSGWLQITLRLPRSWKGSLEARTVTGWMNIRGLTGTDLSLDSVSGLLMGTDLSFMTASARTVTGDMKLVGLSCDRCTLSTTSGEVSLLAAQVQTGAASSVTGGVTLDLLAPFDELTLNTVTGELAVTAPIAECDAMLRSVSGRIRTGGLSNVEGAASRVKAISVSSDLDISNNDLNEQSEIK